MIPEVQVGLQSVPEVGVRPVFLVIKQTSLP